MAGIYAITNKWLLLLTTARGGLATSCLPLCGLALCRLAGASLLRSLTSCFSLRRLTLLRSLTSSALTSC